MPVNACRVCGHAYFDQPLLSLENMPKAAQHFPDAGSLEDDKGVDLTVWQCSACGLVQLSNAPVPYHREVIRAAAVSDVVKELKTRQFADLVRKYRLGGKKIIEIGCGRGEFLALLAPLGVAAYGLEYADAAVAQCVRNGLQVTRGYLDGTAPLLAEGPFDAFLLLMFLEHLPDPNAVLWGIHRNLRDGAVGLIEVPNFDMLVRNRLFSEFIGDHLMYFSRATLQTTLNLNGFEVLEYSEVRDDYVISVVVKRRERLDISHFRDFQDKVASEIRKYIRRFPKNMVAVWGAGHQSLAIIALTKIGNDIRYVVDSSPFKQGKYTPATHLPIVAPDTLITDPVTAVIVIAASYSDEVAAIIRQRYGSAVQVAILRDYGLEELSASLPRQSGIS